MPPMSAHPEDDLKRLLAEEPFVRGLAKQLVVEDSDEVVQQTFLQAIRHGGGDIERPRNWLARIVRNVANNLRRDRHRRVAHQRAAVVEATVPSAADLAEREERRRALVQAVNRLSPSLRTVVLLRWFEGLPPRKIASLLQIPAATVAKQLQRAYERLRHLLDAQYGGQRRAWLLPLVSFAVRPPVPASPLLPVLPALTFGAIVMTTTSKLALVAAVILAVGVWICWPSNVQPPITPPKTSIEASVAPVQADRHKQAIAASVNANSIEREAVTTPAIAKADPTTGSVVVHLRYSDDKTPVPGMMMGLLKLGADSRYSSLRSRTDEAGTVHFEDVQPGQMYVFPANTRGKRVEVIAGETAEVDIELEIGMNLTGIVIGPDRRPIAGALIETTMMARADAFPEVMTVSGADGRFAIRASHTLCLVGARAEGYVASNVRFLHGRKGNSAEVELMLGPKGGMVHGIVVDENGKPVANATVIIGKGKLAGIPGREHIPPFAALTRSDEDGKFHAIGVEAGMQPVMARAGGFAPYEGECQVIVGSLTTLQLTLAKGANVDGVVHDKTGKTVARAKVHVGTWSDFAFFRTRTASDGSYQLSGLPPGETKVEAEHDDLGKAGQVVTMIAGETATMDLTLSLGLQLRGRVVDPEGNPVAKAYCECMAEGTSNSQWYGFAQTNAQGEFVADNCPEKGTISIRVSAQKFEDLRLTDIDPHAGEVYVQLKRKAASTVRIVGTVIAPDGKPLKNATIGIREDGGGGGGGIQSTDDNGRFELGPYPPGKWTVRVHGREYPTYLSEVLELVANETRDLGTITLQEGGTAIVRRLDDGEVKARFIGTNVALKHSVGFTTISGQKRSSAMVPGDYLLLTSGKGVAASATPYSVRAGEQTVIDVLVQKGAKQLLKVTRADGAKVKALPVYVRQGKQLVARVWASAKPDGSAIGVTWLLPGEYTLAGTKGELTGSTTFSVGAAGGPAASITLR